MAGQVTVSDFSMDTKEFQAALAAEVKKMALKGEEDLLELGQDVQNRARQYCPVKTGHLRNSINSVSGRDEKGPFVIIGPDTPYARRIEFGFHGVDRIGRHYDQSAQPYMRPALLEAIAEWSRKTA